MHWDGACGFDKPEADETPNAQPGNVVENTLNPGSDNCSPCADATEAVSADGQEAAVENNISKTPQSEAVSADSQETADENNIPKTPQSEAEEKKLRIKCIFAKAAAVLIFSAMLIGPIVWSLMNGGLYYIYDDNGEIAGIVHSSGGPREAARSVLDLHDEDEIVLSCLGSTEFVTVNRSFPVSITADGKTTTVRIVEGDVADALSLAGISVSHDDIVTPSLTSTIAAQDDGKIVVNRVTYEEREAHEAVAWQEVSKPSPLISEGSARVMNSGGGRDGEADRVYRDMYIDGVLTNSEVVSETITKYPWNVVALEGKSDAVMSSVDGSQFTDVKIVDGVPESYSRVINDGICTAYSFKPGVWGAAGTYLFQGFVAVNPDVIPLGSLLYITGRSGSFVYGWAIAADVGEAMMDGRVDIDCFMETYNESALFGRKTMDVYIVAQLTQEDLEQYAANLPMLRARIPQ